MPTPKDIVSPRGGIIYPWCGRFLLITLSQLNCPDSSRGNVLNALSPASNSKESFAFDGAKIQIPFFTNKFFWGKMRGSVKKQTGNQCFCRILTCVIHWQGDCQWGCAILSFFNNLIRGWNMLAWLLLFVFIVRMPFHADEKWCGETDGSYVLWHGGTSEEIKRADDMVWRIKNSVLRIYIRWVGSSAVAEQTEGCRWSHLFIFH